jgi:hypothetical protein
MLQNFFTALLIVLLTLFCDDCEQNKNVSGRANQDEDAVGHDEGVVGLQTVLLDFNYQRYFTDFFYFSKNVVKYYKFNVY